MYEKFWPKIQEYHQLQSNTIIKRQQESKIFLGLEESNDHFCGPQRERPREVFDPMFDV